MEKDTIDFFLELFRRKATATQIHETVDTLLEIHGGRLLLDVIKQELENSGSDTAAAILEVVEKYRKGGKEEGVKHRTDTRFMNKVKCQMKYREQGTCGFCGRGIDPELSYCDDRCADEAVKIGGECAACGGLTQEGEKCCSEECAQEFVDLNLLEGWFANERDNTGALIFWDDDRVLHIAVYKTADERTARDNPEEMTVRDVRFEYAGS